MKKLARPPNQYHYLLFLILLLGSVPFQVSAEMLNDKYAHGEVGVTPSCKEPPTGSITSSSSSKKTPIKSDIKVSKEGTNEIKIHIPSAEPLVDSVDSGKTRSKICGGRSPIVATPTVVMPIEPPSDPEVSASIFEKVFTPDFFILEISITGDGSGMVTTMVTSSEGNSFEGNSYSSTNCSSEFCEEWYTMLQEFDIKTGGRSDAIRDSSESDSFFVDINAMAEPGPNSKLSDLTCGELQKEEKNMAGETKKAIVIQCTAEFELKPLKISDPLTSVIISKDGNLGDTVVISLESHAPPIDSPPGVSMVTPDFFILEISITGNGSGMVTTSEGNSYSSAECSSEFCEEWYPIILWESDVKKSSRSDATRDSSESDSSVEINVKAEPTPDSKLRDLTCVEPQQEEKTMDGETKYAIVVQCTAEFELKPLEISVPLTSSALGKNGNFSDTATTFLGSVANLTGLDKDDANKVLLHSATDVKITGTIAAEPLHIGQLVDMLAVVGFTPAGTDGNQPSFYYMREGNKVNSWDGNLVTLLAFQENVSAEPEQTLEIYQGSLLDGQYEIYFGYRLEEGTIIFNSEPLRIQLRSANP